MRDFHSVWIDDDAELELRDGTCGLVLSAADSRAELGQPFNPVMLAESFRSMD